MLAALGVGPLQEQVYRAALSRPGTSVDELARMAGADINVVLAALINLEELGLLTRSPGDPHPLVPVAPDVALELLALQRRRELDAARESAKRLADETRATLAPPDRPEVIEVVTGWPAVRQRYLQLQYAAEREVVGFDVPPYSRAKIRLNQTEAERLAAGVRYRSIYDRAAIQHPGQLEQLRHITAAGEESRVAAHLPMKLAIADHRMALLPLRLDDPGLEASLVVHPSPLLDSLMELFELEWERATPIRLEHAVDDQSPKAPDIDATDRELVVLLAAGLTDAAIAPRIGLSMRTVQRRIAQLMSRFGLESRFQLGVHAVNRGWLPSSRPGGT